jgi:hypothetical protein
VTINFDLLGARKSSGQTDPKKLFITLKRDARFVQPTAEQGDVLDQWFARKDSKDTTIKMNTGAGKTLVGLLVLQSSLNEQITPAVYITPDNYLAQQVRNEAADLGIMTTDRDDDARFMRGEAILVTNVHKLFNGKSRFGVGEVRQSIGSIVIDDAHACLSTIDSQFRILLQNDSQAYREIWSLLSDRLKQYDDPKHYAIQNADPNAIFEIPFWIWQERANDIWRILVAHVKEGLDFTLPLLDGVIPLCQAVFSGRTLEIAPRCTPIDAIPAFADAKRRIYMTATLANDGILVSHFRADVANVRSPVQPKTSDMGTRMILAPQELDRDYDEKKLKELAVAVSRTRNVVVIVPSGHRAEYWKDVAAQTLMSENIHDGVNKLRQNHVGITVLVNKYDGVDLPGSACELLILDGMPRAHSAIGRLRANQLEGTRASIIEAVQKVEQGMGRGVRSGSDRCAVILFGSELVRLVNSPSTADKFTPVTQAQLILSRQMSDQIPDANRDSLLSVLQHSFDGTVGWIRASKEAVANSEVIREAAIEAHVEAERIAFDRARMGRHKDASDTIQGAVDRSDEKRTRGYLKQQRAEYINFSDKAEAQIVLSSGMTDNVSILRPLEGVKYTRAVAHADQAIAAGVFLNNFRSQTDLLTWLDTVIDKLSWDPEGTERFEDAMESVGALLGFASQRPERDTGNGPDNFWAMSVAQPAAVIECKSGATADQVWRKDCNQLLGSSEWFKLHYPNQPHAPVLVHPSRVFAADASPSAEMRVIDREHLASLKIALVAYGKAAWGTLGPKGDADIARQLAEQSLTAALFLQKYSTAPQR